MRKVQELVTNTQLIPSILGNLINNQQMIYGKMAENKENELKAKTQANSEQPSNQDEVLLCLNLKFIYFFRNMVI